MLKFSEIYRPYPGQERRWRLRKCPDNFPLKPAGPSKAKAAMNRENDDNYR
ncbi:hypothetical protein J2X37_002191 [Croceicoccus sp. BE223]|nr:hypothetical protein [Croceicoccus sp. BE223]